MTKETTDMNPRRLGWILGGAFLVAAAVITGARAGGCCGEKDAGEQKDQVKKEEKKEAPRTALYPLDTCPLSGKKLGSEGEAVIFDYRGREFRFSSKDCIMNFMKDPEGSIAKIDAAIIQQQLPNYPMTTCLVSGDAFGGEMGEPINKVYQNRLVRFCCKMCQPDFEKDPAKFLAKLDAAILSKQKPFYPLDTCVVSGDKLEGDMGGPFEYVFGTRLVRMCCKGCVKDFAKDPQKFMAKIDEAAKTKKEAAKHTPKEKDEDKGRHDHHEHKH